MLLLITLPRCAHGYAFPERNLCECVSSGIDSHVAVGTNTLVHYDASPASYAQHLFECHFLRTHTMMCSALPPTHGLYNDTSGVSICQSSRHPPRSPQPAIHKSASHIHHQLFPTLRQQRHWRLLSIPHAEVCFTVSPLALPLSHLPYRHFVETPMSHINLIRGQSVSSARQFTIQDTHLRLEAS